jgi:hypothetical protein
VYLSGNFHRFIGVKETEKKRVDVMLFVIIQQLHVSFLYSKICLVLFVNHKIFGHVLVQPEIM